MIKKIASQVEIIPTQWNFYNGKDESLWMVGRRNPEIHNGKNPAPSTNVAEQTELLHAEECKYIQCTREKQVQERPLLRKKLEEFLGNQ